MRCSKGPVEALPIATTKIEMYGEFLRKEIEKKNILRNDPNRTFI